MKAKFYTGVILCFIVLLNLLLWIRLSIAGDSFEKTKNNYLNYFPVFLRNAIHITLLSILISCVSFYLIESSKDSGNRLERLLGQYLNYLNILMVCWMIFSLM